MTYFEFPIKFKLLLALSKQLNINNLIMYISKIKGITGLFSGPLTVYSFHQDQSEQLL